MLEVGQHISEGTNTEVRAWGGCPSFAAKVRSALPEC